ncbi:MAG: homocysteine S-methyltransferase family protein [Eubacteriales bacterium]
MKILDYLKENLLFLDGGMGTLLQERGLLPGELPEKWNLSHPEVIQDIHRAYFDAGSNVVSTNTFGANLLKFSPDELEKIIAAAVKNACIAKEMTSNKGEKFIALDIGPTGKLLKPYGDLDFEDAVSLFAETVKLGVKYGVDLILIETMNDSYETKAALLAAKENSSLPVFVSNAYGSDMRLMTGASPSAMVAMLEGMGADAIGANCSLGPRQLAPVVKELLEYASVPVLLMPNAGLPEIKDGKTIFNVTPKDFADEVNSLIEQGVRIVGGCCGTTPEYIDALARVAGKPIKTERKNRTLVSSYTHSVEIGNSPILIGERINPTGKKRFKQALSEHDLDFILKEGLEQESAGAHILDVNVGLPEIDEVEMIKEVTCSLQAVCALPLQIDTSDPSAMEAALRLYNGKAMINSVNGKAESMRAIFPLVKKYGGVCVALTLDEGGIPESAEGRVEIAKKILAEAEKYGIDKKDIIFDTLTMTVSADPRAANVTLEALRRVRDELGAKTTLGVSNVSFGLPNRDILNSIFFANALENGLKAAIMNPYSAEMMKVYHAYRALHGLDENCAEYISFASTLITQTTTISGNATGKTDNQADTLRGAIIKGLGDKARDICREMLTSNAPLDIVNSEIIPALDEVGRGFEAHTVYLPGLLMSAEAARAAFEPIKVALSNDKNARQDKATIIMATVKGDIHDIGKNIVCLLLENYGYKVVDLGRDVAPERVLEAAQKFDAKIVGLSALMTTTVPAMEETIKLLRKEAPHIKIMVGGAVLTKDYAERIGADFYGEDAMSSVRYAESLDDLT